MHDRDKKKAVSMGHESTTMAYTSGALNYPTEAQKLARYNVTRPQSYFAVYYANCILQRPFKFGGYVLKDVTDTAKDGVNSFYEYSFADMPAKYNHILVLAKSQVEGYEQSHYGPQDFIRIP